MNNIDQLSFQRTIRLIIVAFVWKCECEWPSCSGHRHDNASKNSGVRLETHVVQAQSLGTVGEVKRYGCRFRGPDATLFAYLGLMFLSC